MAKQIEHFYENIGENWFSYAKFYKDMVELLPDGSQIVELGCWKGRSTTCLGVEIINSGKDITLHCVDSWKYHPNTEQPVSCQEDFDKVYEEFLINTRLFKDFIIIHKNDSIIASEDFKYKSLDFIFIDASHKEKDMYNDLGYWSPKIKDGGIIAGHDYFTNCHPGVKKAVDGFFSLYRKNLHLIKEQNIWVYHRNV